ncbi:phytanoyl-dioxygenase [Diplodia corticola]|uniref:Phytanoyl-dioxygenase n=1 Tax=Diplodia corticola TaxID=236234 RepID=A0A1J9S4M3_9PEZI|nr:phytanoyl-dioxygenase [Diplodia corticola]OJD34581.1 phytanoyl-dioxygenase [Diplodia corticola]
MGMMCKDGDGEFIRLDSEDVLKTPSPAPVNRDLHFGSIYPLHIYRPSQAQHSARGGYHYPSKNLLEHDSSTCDDWRDYSHRDGMAITKNVVTPEKAEHYHQEHLDLGPSARQLQGQQIFSDH